MKVKTVGVSLAVKKIPAEDGVYKATLCGYVVDLELPSGTVEVMLDYGVRGLNVPCEVVVKDGLIVELST